MVSKIKSHLNQNTILISITTVWFLIPQFEQVLYQLELSHTLTINKGASYETYMPSAYYINGIVNN
jgi:hypothetical protein